ncbi:MAG: SPASM domain-containing protein [Parachlamydiales bacterium]|nr:SPASM domain-containing protein [Parachlamydiales bacterium]
MSFLKNFKEVRIENTNACHYKCIMCPREKLMRKIGIMKNEDFLLVMKRLKGFEGVFHLHGFGEPLLDRGLLEKVKLAKKYYPGSKSAIITTLGVKIENDYFEKLIKSGLDTLTVSIYGFTKKNYQQVHKFDGLNLVKKNLLKLSNAMKNKKGDFHANIKIPGPTNYPLITDENLEGIKSFIDWCENTGFKIKTWPYVHNYGIGRSYNLDQNKKVCPVIDGARKQILNITWDLNVVPCHFDFNSSIKIGNLRDKNLEEIFKSEKYFDFVLAHKTNNFSSFLVCQNCEKLEY